MTQRVPAALALEDGTVLHGWSCGAPGEAAGEICFNTSMTGYQEILTDPSYSGQIVTMTMPHIGNYGANGADMESRGIFARGFVVREMSWVPSNWRAEEALPDFLARLGVVAIEGVDTRRLTKHIREAGAMRAVISTVDLDAASLVAKAKGCQGLVGVDLVSGAAIESGYRWGSEAPPGVEIPVDTGIVPAQPTFKVAAIDTGIKYNILRRLSESGCEVTVVPPTTSAEDVLAMGVDGLFMANGPGDPSAVGYVYGTLRDLIGKVPIFGICLGHQMLGLAVGAQTYKLKYGHRGGNQPVKNLLTGQVEITAQNHGFCVDFADIGPLMPEESAGLTHEPGDLGAWSAAGVAPVVRSELFGRVQLTHVNLNDMTVEGIRLLDAPAFSVQYHPEAAPGPHDSRYLFGAFARLMEGRDDYLSAGTEGDTR
ncbi:MAG: glutamine-hydrolyzing carbamoyl-phosphate synthase small subunit [Coriobacteriales bacterium]|nr:glutamine-hydrolyzing carbamoyl-phosphate synthase small subunit [Coriobacteriales bacterium]